MVPGLYPILSSYLKTYHLVALMIDLGIRQYNSIII